MMVAFRFSIKEKDQIVFDLCNYLLDLDVDFDIDYQNPKCIGAKLPLNWNLHIPFRGKEVFINLYNEEAYESNGLMDELKELNEKRQAFIDAHDNFEMINMAYGTSSNVLEIEKDIVDRITMYLKDL